jgi:MFS family permease
LQEHASQKTPRWRATGRAASIRAVVGLGTTQIIGWGTSFSTITVFGSAIGEELNLPRVLVFAGITLQLLVSAILSPRIGKLVDRLGARHIMTIGSFVAAGAMLVQSSVSGLASYMLGWIIIGLAAPLMLNNAAMPGLVQVVGPNARRWITGLTLMSGLTSTVFLPINFFLLETVGWRTAYLIFAALHVLICAPIHWLVVRRGAGVEEQTAAAAKGLPPPDGLLKPEQRRRAFVLLSIWTCTEGLLTWGLYMQVIDILKALGLTAGAAVGVWAVVGPAQAGARLGELVFAGRYSILTTALFSAVLTTFSFSAFLFFGVSVYSAILFCVLMGLGHGFFAVARNTLPLALFGAREYGSWMGLLMAPQNVANAAAPLLFAALISYWSPVAAVWAAGIGAALGLVAVVTLVRFCRSSVAENSPLG